jgi:hypothetical protein
MKQLRRILPLALALAAFWSCSSRSTAIPTALESLSTALNTADQAAFKKLIWTSAADYTAIQNDTVNVSNLVFFGSYRYKYYFSNASVPSSGNSPLSVKVECTVESYLSDTLISSKTYSVNDSSTAKFEFANGSTIFFLEDWKYSKIWLPGFADPLVKLPRFFEFVKP